MNYLDLKASLAQTVHQKMNALAESDIPYLDSIEWDVSNVYPKQGLPEVRDQTRCKFRCRLVVEGPLADPSLGSFVSPHTTKPKFLISSYGRDKRASAYLAAQLKEQLDKVTIARVDAISFDNYSQELNCFHSDILVTLLVGSLTFDGQHICQPQSQHQQSICQDLDIHHP